MVAAVAAMHAAEPLTCGAPKSFSIARSPSLQTRRDAGRPSIIVRSHNVAVIVDGLLVYAMAKVSIGALRRRRGRDAQLVGRVDA